MDPVLEAIRLQLPEHGPWLLFALAALETSFVTGLVVPSGVATSIGTALALGGAMPLAPLLVGAAAGGWVGDAVGYWLGRRMGDRILAGRGRLSRLAAARHDDLEDFFGRHPVVSVTVGRLISFVRTLMPMAAGMSGISFRRFLPYEALGLAGWLAIYVSLGAFAGESWERLSRWLGTGGAAVFVLLAVAVLWMARRRRDAAPAAGVEEPGG